MTEIAENLHRRELGEIERAELMARWVEITAAKHEADAKEAAAKAQATDKPAHLAQVSNRGGRGKRGDVSQAARELGVPRDQVARAVKIAALSPEAKRLAKKLKAPQAAHLACDQQSCPQSVPRLICCLGFSPHMCRVKNVVARTGRLC